MQVWRAHHNTQKNTHARANVSRVLTRGGSYTESGYIGSQNHWAMEREKKKKTKKRNPSVLRSWGDKRARAHNLSVTFGKSRWRTAYARIIYKIFFFFFEKKGSDQRTRRRWLLYDLSRQLMTRPHNRRDTRQRRSISHPYFIV